ncbi:MAG: hypothetical protein QNK29_14215, partial [Desulfobacterales bacterium]|nr:hypothetical protein [Desulfobacterales bacterium]
DLEFYEEMPPEFHQMWLAPFINPVPDMLTRDGQTPRQAARSPELKPRIIEMLKDLEHHYEAELTRGRPGFDPSWMWEELGLESENPDSDHGGYLPLTGFEAMERLVKGMGDVVRKIATGYRKGDYFDDTMILDRSIPFLYAGAYPA